MAGVIFCGAELSVCESPQTITAVNYLRLGEELFFRALIKPRPTGDRFVILKVFFGMIEQQLGLP